MKGSFLLNLVGVTGVLSILGCIIPMIAALVKLLVSTQDKLKTLGALENCKRTVVRWSSIMIFLFTVFGSYFCYMDNNLILILGIFIVFIIPSICFILLINYIFKRIIIKFKEKLNR